MKPADASVVGTTEVAVIAEAAWSPWLDDRRHRASSPWVLSTSNVPVSGRRQDRGERAAEPGKALSTTESSLGQW